VKNRRRKKLREFAPTSRNSRNDLLSLYSTLFAMNLFTRRCCIRSFAGNTSIFHRFSFSPFKSVRTQPTDAFLKALPHGAEHLDKRSTMRRQDASFCEDLREIDSSNRCGFRVAIHKVSRFESNKCMPKG